MQEVCFFSSRGNSDLFGTSPILALLVTQYPVLEFFKKNVDPSTPGGIELHVLKTAGTKTWLFWRDPKLQEM